MIGEARGEVCSREEMFSQTFSPPVVIIETRALIRECLALCLQDKLGLPVLTYPDVNGWREDPAATGACVVILSGVERQIDHEQGELIRELSRWEREVPVVVFSDGENKSQIASRLRCGAKGYVPSDTPLEVVARAIKLVLVGGVFVPANVVMESRPDEETEPVRADARLDFTIRENDVVKALLRGKSNKVIAYELSMSESSVKVHIRNVMRKLQVRNRTEAVIRIAEIVRAQTDHEETASPYCA